MLGVSDDSDGFSNISHENKDNISDVEKAEDPRSLLEDTKEQCQIGYGVSDDEIDPGECVNVNDILTANNHQTLDSSSIQFID